MDLSFPSCIKIINNNINNNNETDTAKIFLFQKERTKPVFTFSKLTIETLQQGVKYVQS